MGWYKAPKHQVLSEAQSKKALKIIGVDYDELPLIKLSDAAIIDLINTGSIVVPGDVIRIYRQSKTAGGDFEYYRRVVV